MKPHEIVLDTNVLVSSLRSREGASFRLLRLVGGAKFKIHLSVALALEYEASLKKPGAVPAFSAAEKDDLLDYLCSVARLDRVHFLWRPYLPDPGDDMVLELAVAGGADKIITFNKADFEGSEKLGVQIMTPKEFLGLLGELP